MAVGDIKKFGILKVNNTEFSQRPSQYAITPGDNEFTFVSTDDESKKWEWIEFELDGIKTYICKTLAVLGVTYDYFIKYKNREFKIDNNKYVFKVFSEFSDNENFVKNKIPISIADKIDFTNDNGYPVYMMLEGSHGTVYGTGHDMIAYSEYGDNNKIWRNQGYLDVNATGDGGILPVLQLINNAPTISGEDENLGNKTSSFSITYSISDEDSDQELTVKEKLNGSIIRTLKNPTQNSTLTFTIADELFASLSMNTTNTIEIEVTDGSATTYRRYTFVKTNSAPFITYTGQADLGELTTKPSITYTVKDNEGDAITVTEKLNGEVINQFSATTNTNYTVGITDTFWLTCGSNTNTVEIIASDALGGSSSKTITFSRKITKLQIVMKNAIETDAKATKILVSPQWTTTGGVGKVEVCNNGFDSNPTWEDATTMVVLNRPYLFTNSSKTASKWGIKIRITVTKNQGYDGEVAIFGFGGAYE